MSSSAGRLQIQLGRRMSAGRERELGTNAITVASTAYLVVPKDVTAFRAGIGVIVERDTQPVPKRTPALSVLEVETQSGRRHYIQPISSMWEAR